MTEIASRLVLPFINMVLARLLTPEAFGVIATVNMIVSFAEIFTDAGFQKYLVQHDFEDEEELDNNTNVAFWTNLLISVVLWLLIFFFSEQLAILVGNPGLGNVIVIASLVLPVNAFSSIQMARYKRDWNFKSLFYVRLVSICVPLFVTLPLAYITKSFWALVIGTLSGAVVNAVILTCRSRWKPKLFFSIKKLKEMFSYSWWIMMESISTWMTSYFDTFIVGIFLSTFYVGIYKTSMITVNQIISLITSATSMPLFVALSRLKNDRDALIDMYNNYMQAVAFFVFPLSIGIWIYRDFITFILLGSQWKEAADFIGLWGLLSSISIVLGTYANGLYNAIGKTYISFLVALINILYMIPILFWSAPLGFETLYISRSSVRILFVIIQLLMMSIYIKYPIFSLIKKLLPIIPSTVLMAIVALLLNMISQAYLWNFVCIFICIFVYFTSMFIINKKLLNNSLQTLGVNIKMLKKSNHS